MQETGRTTGPPAGSRPHSSGTILSVTTESPAAFPTVMRILKTTWHVSQSEDKKERHNPNWICFLNGTQFKLKGVYFHQAENYHRNNAEDVRCERASSGDFLPNLRPLYTEQS
ncbi:hypothetical protein X801_05087 [Opisthorchis viverrini]|uniref:Uncharacterized protein n=1 Tax=Opisthorchis viverrini TaxID=6198 RepID=A0A1S8WX03_OPIVI|nr:hypothetical protein X801_05087 [Opisthorchis viverrini]